MTVKTKRQILEAWEYFNSHRDIRNNIVIIRDSEVKPETDNPYIIKFFDNLLSISNDTDLVEYFDWYLTNLHDTLAVDKIKSNISKGMEYAP